jgi:hypothetical protein
MSAIYARIEGDFPEECDPWPDCDNKLWYLVHCPFCNSLRIMAVFEEDDPECRFVAILECLLCTHFGFKACLNHFGEMMALH